MVESNQNGNIFKLSVNVRIKPLLGNEKKQEEDCPDGYFVNEQAWERGIVSIGHSK